MVYYQEERRVGEEEGEFEEEEMEEKEQRDQGQVTLRDGGQVGVHCAGDGMFGGGAFLGFIEVLMRVEREDFFEGSGGRGCVPN